MFVPDEPRETTQASLFDAWSDTTTRPRPDARFTGLVRAELSHGAWLDHAPRWLEGDAALYDDLTGAGSWAQPDVKMYDRTVTTPRLVARLDPQDHPALAGMVEVLSDRYGVRLEHISANWYRNGADSVAWHGDRIARERDTATVATVSLRGPRAFRYKPAAGGPASGLTLGHGDLVVMGGSFQRTWRHAVPKTKAVVPPRIVVMFRHSYD
jgi:alkylated DNA repair dioxygenase AlkB